MDGAASRKLRSCPVCEESVPADTKLCPSCSTDLSLFPVEDLPAGEAAPDQDAYVAGILQQAEAQEVAPQAATYEEVAECPNCAKIIPADAAKCPNCGVEFEVEEVFECPMCKSLLGLDVTQCPSCGTVFNEPAAAPPVEAPAPEPEPQPQPEERPPEKAGPVSFVDRLKQIKDEPPKEAPAPEPAAKREMSFAERMKAMKNAPQPEPASQQPAAQPAAPPQQPAPQPRPEQKPQVSQPQPKQEPKPQTPQQAPAQQPPRTGQTIADRVQSLKQGAPQTQQAPAQQPPATQAAAPAPKPAEQPRAEPPQEGYKELPHHIADVKKLLLLANELKIDVSTSKALINRAVTAGKSRDLENAIKLVKEGKAGLERDIKANLTAKLRTLETALGLEKKAGKNVAGLEAMAGDIRKSMDVGDLQVAWEAMKRLEDSIMKSASGKLSEVEFQTIAKAISDSEALGLNVADAKMLYEEARKSAAAGDQPGSMQLIKQAMESLNKILPAFIAAEMRRAKVTVREAKMMNVEISVPVTILKEANDFVLNGDYCSALDSIRRFKEFIDREMPRA